VLLLWGDHDQIFPLEKAFAIKSWLPTLPPLLDFFVKGVTFCFIAGVQERVRLEIFENTGHVPQMEDLDRFNRIVLDFLLSSPKPPSLTGSA
jgi:pimeloyl-ACP methyl ester carboxylesterase